MTEFPVWVWVVGVIGTIAAGIGLGYLIIFLFWKIEKYFSPPPPAPVIVQPEVKEEEPPEEPVEEPEPVEEEIIEPMDQQIEEEVIPVMAEETTGEKGRSIKFATVLHSRFNHSFRNINTIVCWEVSLEDGEEVVDREGKSMKLQVVKPHTEAEKTRYLLIDESGQKTISVVHGKEYVKKETKVDIDRISR
jgi:hypothetical protein